MKGIRFILAAACGLAATGGWSLDVSRVGSLEGRFGPLMGQNDVATLLEKDRALEPSLATASDETKIEAGIVAINLSRALAAQGTKGYAVKAAARLDGPAHHGEPEVRVFALTLWGVALTLEGNEDTNPAAKVTDVTKGWAALDEAVDLFGTQSWVPRFYRANVGQALPPFFEKEASVNRDLTALAAWDAANPHRMADPIRALVALYQGNAFKRAKNLDAAIASWHQALALDPNKTGAGKNASEQLDLYE